MPRAGLDPGTVTREAYRLMDAEPDEELTLSLLATSLGVATPSLYKHVGGLADLHGRVAVLALTELADELGAAVRGRAARDALGALADGYRRFARAHPSTYRRIQRAPASPETGAASDRVLAVIVDALSGYGLTPADVDVIRVVRAALHGFVDLERGDGFGMPVSVDGSFTTLVDMLDSWLRTHSLGATGR